MLTLGFDATITKVRLSQPITDAEAAECDLQLVDIEMTTSGDAIYVYEAMPVADNDSKLRTCQKRARGDESAARWAGDARRDESAARWAHDADDSAFVEFMNRFRKDTLQKMCEDLGIKISGNRSELIARIAAKM